MVIGTDYLVDQPAMGFPNWGPSRLSAEAANRANGVAVSRLAKARLGSRRSGRGNDTSFYAPCTLETTTWQSVGASKILAVQKVSEIGPLEGRLIQYGSSRGPPQNVHPSNRGRERLVVLGDPIALICLRGVKC